MRQLYRAEVRGSAGAWAAVSFTFVGLAFALALSLMVADTGMAAHTSGLLTLPEASSIFSMGYLNVVLCSLVGLSVVGSSTSLVVNSRRGSVARIALAGATPGQVVQTVMVQLAVVSIACSVAGAVLAVPALAPAVTFVATTRDGGVPVPPMVYNPGSIVLAALVTLGVALLGGWRQARRASRIPPVEALRQATIGVESRHGWLRWTMFGLWLVVIAGAFAAAPTIVAMSPAKEAFTNVFFVSMLMLVVAGIALAAGGPLTVGGLTRLWTAAIPPSASPTWHLARNTVLAKSERLSRSVVPAMFAVGLLFGMEAMGASLIATVYLFDPTTQLENSGIDTLIHFLGMPIALALLASVGSLVMMGRQRDAELALAGIVGATPAQQRVLPVMEGLIISVTATILGLVMTATCLGYAAFGITFTQWPFVGVLPWAVLVATAVVVALITIAATALPTLPALRLPAPRVIARLVAD